jgi:hypothetical protein
MHHPTLSVDEKNELLEKSAMPQNALRFLARKFGGKAIVDAEKIDPQWQEGFHRLRDCAEEVQKGGGEASAHTAPDHCAVKARGAFQVRNMEMMMGRLREGSAELAVFAERAHSFL